jgi:uncharacterized protein YbcI
MRAPTAATVKAEISRELLRVQEVSFGETDGNIEVSLNKTFVAVIMDLDLSPAEETLIDSGNAASVKISRDSYQSAIAATSAAIVERATGRRVISFASCAVLDEGPAWAIDIFRLGRATVAF